MISTHLCLLVYFIIFNDCKLKWHLGNLVPLGDLVQVNILRLYLRFRLPWDTYKRGIYRGTDIIRQIEWMIIIFIQETNITRSVFQMVPAKH
jgi:hypothetical protein